MDTISEDSPLFKDIGIIGTISEIRVSQSQNNDEVLIVRQENTLHLV